MPGLRLKGIHFKNPTKFVPSATSGNIRSWIGRALLDPYDHFRRVIKVGHSEGEWVVFFEHDPRVRYHSFPLESVLRSNRFRPKIRSVDRDGRFIYADPGAELEDGP